MPPASGMTTNKITDKNSKDSESALEKLKKKYENQISLLENQKTYIENGSWGPKFDGSSLRYGNIYSDGSVSMQKYKSYSAIKNNLQDFFDTGFRYNNSVSFSNIIENDTCELISYFFSFFKFIS